MAVEKLSLRRGEVLLLVSDGVQETSVQGLTEASPDGPLGELAARILEHNDVGEEDDATAVLIRLRPTGLPTS